MCGKGGGNKRSVWEKEKVKAGCLEGGVESSRRFKRKIYGSLKRGEKVKRCIYQNNKEKELKIEKGKC